MSSNYRKIYEQYYGIKIPKGMHIHHIDGDKNNNGPLNLQMVTPEEHCKLHLERGDPWYDRKLDKWIQGASKAGKLGGAKSLGRKLTKEHKEKLARKMRGKSRPKHIVEKIAAKNRGKRRTIESRKRISKAHIGLDNHQKGRKISLETRTKLSQSHKGQVPWMKGKRHSNATKEKMRKARNLFLAKKSMMEVYASDN